MRIFVNDQWRIATDAFCFRVQKYAGVYQSGPKMNTPKWVTMKYCSTLSRALKVIAHFMVLESDTDTSSEAFAALSRIGKLFDDVLEKIEKRTGDCDAEKTQA